MNIPPIALWAAAPVERRRAAIDALSGLPEPLLRPILEAVASDADPALAARGRATRRQRDATLADVLADGQLPDSPAAMSALIDAAGSTPVGTITESIFRGGDPPGDDRGVESAAGNLVADAQLWSTSSNGAEVAFMNPGGVRSDLLYPESAGEGDGVVTFGEAFTFQPFGNTLVTFPMTGAQIISVLEEQCQPLNDDGTIPSRPFLHLGVSDGFTYDLAKTIENGLCTSITVSNVQLDGVPLDTAAMYNVTVNNFLADGGDNFDTFATITAPRLDGGNDLNALVNYLGTFSPVAPPSTDRVNELN